MPLIPVENIEFGFATLDELKQFANTNSQGAINFEGNKAVIEGENIGKVVIALFGRELKHMPDKITLYAISKTATISALAFNALPNKEEVLKKFNITSIK